MLKIYGGDLLHEIHDEVKRRLRTLKDSQQDGSGMIHAASSRESSVKGSPHKSTVEKNAHSSEKIDTGIFYEHANERGGQSAMDLVEANRITSNMPSMEEF